MITEDYVSFETAKLLKEKGFDEPVLLYHRYGKAEPTCPVERILSKNSDLSDACSIPTLQMSIKWLREEYKIFICIVFLEETDMYGFTIEDISSKKDLATSKNDEYSTYEQTCEAAIKYCLQNLI